MALAFVVNAMQRHAIARGATNADQLKELPGIEQVVSAVAMLAGRADLEVSPFVAAWDPAIPSVDPDGRSIAQHSVEKLSEVILGGIGGHFGPDHGKVARELAKAMDSYMSSPAVGSGTFAELQRWLTRQVLKDVDRFDRNDATVDYLRPLVRWAAANHAVVSTLNYDECLETAADHESVPVDLAVEQWAATGLLDDRIDSPPMRLLKLHGSVNWCFVEGAGFRLTRPPDVWSSPKYEPGIVYGQRGKLRPEGPFLQLLEAFRNELELSAKLLVIGYSFGDDHINTLVESWIQRDPSRSMLVVDPCFPDYPEYPSSGQPADTRKKLWRAYGPGRAPIVHGSEEQVRAGGPINVPPIASQMYAARIGTKDFLVDLARHGLEELFEQNRNDPPIVQAYYQLPPDPAS